jgi:hypothetical protein
MALQFDGSGEYLLSTSLAGVSGVPYTFGCWAYLDTGAAGTDVAIMLGDSTAVTYEEIQFFTGNGKLRLRTLSSGGSNLAGALWSYDTWHHVMAVVSATDSRALYLDGGGKVTSSVDKTVTIDEITIGARTISSATNYMLGRLAHAAVWAAALTDEEVAALAAGASPLDVRPSSLLGYWPLWGLHSPELDMLGATQLTVAGTPTQADCAPLGVTWPGAGYMPEVEVATIIGPPYSAAASGMWSAGHTVSEAYLAGSKRDSAYQAGAVASGSV